MTSCGSGNKRYQASFLELFDTVTTIIGYAKDEATFSKKAQMIYDDLKVYHELYDIYNNYEGINNIKTINDNAGIQPVKVDQKIIDLLKFSEEAYDMSKGKKNIALGAVLQVWHDYREEGTNDPENAKLPPMELLKEKAEHTDIHDIIIDEEASTVYLADPEMSLDVGAVAKGYATERVAQYMIGQGYTSLLLSVGGNVRAIGSRDEADKLWSVGIQNPDLESDKQYLMITKLENLSLVTSGDYERYYTVDGVRYHHIIDPDTLMPANYYTAVSIITKDSGLADALSATLFNMPLEEGKALIESMEGTEAMWVNKDGSLVYSSGFEKFIKKD
ncbi:MAG TPA: FAD:protein FMN transferase [Clostridiales bacterium]|nr:FAD:protein FMN transferase [Clostridiales bacterium]